MVEYTLNMCQALGLAPKKRKEEKRRKGSVWFWRKFRDPNLFYLMVFIGPNKMPKPKELRRSAASDVSPQG